MTIKPFLVDGNIVVNEATITNSGTSIVLPTNSHFSGGGNIFNLATNTTDDVTQGTTNLYFTNTRADARADVRISAASITALSDADQTVQTTDNVTFNNITTTGYIAGPASFTIDPAAVGDNTGTVVIAGDLTVNGTTTTVNSNTVNIGDNILVLNSDETGTPSQDAGLEVERGTSTNVSLKWNETTDKWQFTNDGSTYINIGTASVFTGDTDGVSEGSSNLYFTNARADTRATLRITAADIGNLNNVDETGVANNKILKYNSTSSKWEVADDAGGIADLVDDTTPQLGGNLDTNGKNINFGDSATAGTDDTLQFGAGPDLRMYHDGSNSYIDHIGPDQQTLYIRNTTSTTNTTDGIVLESNNHYVHIANNAAVRFGIGGNDKVSVISTGTYFNHDVILNGNGYDLKFRNGTNYVTLTASVSGNSTANLPNFDGTIPVFTTAPTSAITDGTAGQVLQTNGSGALSFVDQAEGAVGGGTDKTFLETDNSVNSNYTLSTNRNAMTTGPVTINSGATITVPSGQRWIIL